MTDKNERELKDGDLDKIAGGGGGVDDREKGVPQTDPIVKKESKTLDDRESKTDG